jgi:hypothetical protein
VPGEKVIFKRNKHDSMDSNMNHGQHLTIFMNGDVQKSVFHEDKELIRVYTDSKGKSWSQVLGNGNEV